jgi:tRNA-dihydrouridine synthase B
VQSVENALYHNVKIGSLEVEGNLFLAPLAGYTDRAFRSLAVEHGACLTYSEMVSAEGVARNNSVTDELMIREDNEKFYAIQLFGNDDDVLKRSIEKVLEFPSDIIDLNSGCPVPKVVKTGSGSALMKNPEMLYKMVKVLKEATSIPISVKIRLGWDLNSINYLEVTDALLSANVDMITMHARTRSMGYSGTAMWDDLTTLKKYIDNKSPHVPLFGSGDLFTPLDAKMMLEQTKVDGIMFARGALGNPFIFEQTKELLLTGEEPLSVPIKKKLETMVDHLHSFGAIVGEEKACREMRKHAAAYLKGFAKVKEAKQALVKANTYKEYHQVVEHLLS